MLKICEKPNKIKFFLFVVIFALISFENQSLWAEERDEYYNLQYDCDRHFRDGTVWRDGDCKSFYPDREVMVVAHFSGDRLNGELKEYFDNGELKAELNYEYGKRTGSGKFYYKSGKLKAEDNYRYGVPVGTFEFYYESGPTAYTIESKEYYIGGKLDEKEWFYPNGKLWKHALHYKGNGVIDGFLEEYDDDGKIKSKEEYKKGRPDGMSEEFYKSGAIKTRRYYENGHEIREAQFYPDNSEGSLKGAIESKVVKPMQPYPKGTANSSDLKSNHAKVYLKNGQIIKCLIMEKDKTGILANVDGKTVYFSNAQIKEIVETDALSSNEDKIYLKNGKVFECSSIEKDKNGVWVEVEGGKVYFSNSEIKEIIKADASNTETKNENQRT